MNTFAPEIFSRIFSHVEDPQTFRSWLTSSVLLANIARPMLYGSIVITSSNKEPVPKSMTHLIRSLTFVAYPSRIVCFSLLFMTNLEELNFDCDVGRVDWENILNILKPGQVKRLALSREASEALQGEKILLRFARIFHSL